MWMKVDDRFYSHPKVHAAASELGGRRAVGRVAAVWLEIGLYACGLMTDGFIRGRRSIAFAATTSRAWCAARWSMPAWRTKRTPGCASMTSPTTSHQLTA